MKGERELVANMVDNAFLGAIDIEEHKAEGPLGRSSVDVFFTKKLEDPSKRPLFVTHLPKHLVPDDEIERSPEAPDWWIGGMQKYVVNSLYFAIDYEDEDFIYVFFHAQNSMKCLKMLGRMASSLEIPGLVRRAYHKFMRESVWA
jgi:hypothetical protein